MMNHTIGLVFFLPLAEFWYNTSHHSAIGMSPFQALYGHTPPSLAAYVPGSSKIATLDELLSQSAEISKILKFNLNRARNRMVQQANLKRSDKTFEVGDWVYLKIQPYRQITIRGWGSQKLAHRFYGPFRILRRIGQVAYELELPPSSHIHLVFHISLLKQCHGVPATQIAPLVPMQDSTEQEDGPLQILGRRSALTEKEVEEEFLVVKEGQPKSEAKWVLKSTLQQGNRTLDLEDKICLFFFFWS